MAADHSLDLRIAVVKTLKNDAQIATITEGRVHDTPPARVLWPFVRYGMPLTMPYEASCWSGSEHDVTIHAFATGASTDAVATLAKAVVRVLDDADLPLDPLGLVGLDWVRTQVIRDTEEADGWHAIIQFTCQTVEQGA